MYFRVFNIILYIDIFWLYFGIIFVYILIYNPCEQYFKLPLVITRATSARNMVCSNQMNFAAWFFKLLKQLPGAKNRALKETYTGHMTSFDRWTLRQYSVLPFLMLMLKRCLNILIVTFRHPIIFWNKPSLD